MNITNRLFLKKLIPFYKKKKYETFITFRDIEINKYFIDK